jgi:hypothetical protein
MELYAFLSKYIQLLYIETPIPYTNRHVHAHKCFYSARDRTRDILRSIRTTVPNSLAGKQSRSSR